MVTSERKPSAAGGERSAKAPAPAPKATTPAAKPVAVATPPAPRFLTRVQVAQELGVSISTVRRLEGDQLHPRKSKDGVNIFDPGEVRAVAETLKQPVHRGPRTGEKLDPDELAARAFERFERREALAEVVIALRVRPEIVRALYHEWLVGLTEHELKHRKRPAAPPRAHGTNHERLVELIGSLPDTAVRISIARSDGDWNIPEGEDGFIATELLVELGGFITHGPFPVDVLARRYGAHHHRAYRVTAFRLDPAALLWEVMAPLSPPAVAGRLSW